MQAARTIDDCLSTKNGHLYLDQCDVVDLVGRYGSPLFVLSENQGLKYADIAEVMEIPVGTVKSRMHTAVRRLRELLKDVYDEAG